GAPLEGIRLRSFGPNHPEGSLLSLFSAVTGPNGRCQFRVMPGPNELVAISPDASSKAPVREAFHVPEGPRFEAAIRVDGPAFAPAVLTGRVAHADGTPAPGVIVHAQMQNQAEI